MPYVPSDRRHEIDNLITDMGKHYTPENAGDMNYLTSQFIRNYLKDKGLNYANLNEMIGMLECCKMELYRLIGSPYEDLKMQENGPVYDIEMPKKGY